MKSLITKKEEKKFYLHTYALHPIYFGLLFAILIYLLYNLFNVIAYGIGFKFDWYPILIGLGFGIFEGLLNIFITMRLNKKEQKLYFNFNKKQQSDIYIPVFLKKGLFNESKGVLLISKENVEYKVYQLFEKKSLFNVPSTETNIVVDEEKNHWLTKILTLTKKTNVLKLTTKDNEYQFVIPCLEDVSHRIKSYHIS